MARQGVGGLRPRVSAPPGVEPLNWLLLTTRPVRDATDALDTVIGYKLRWRVEEFHRSWKSAGCNTELTHLTGAHGIQLWATILASVATRILRMTYLSRNTPDMPANVEFTDVEIEAAYLMNKKRSVLGRMPTIAVVTHLIAQAGACTRSARAPARRPDPRTRPDATCDLRRSTRSRRGSSGRARASPRAGRRRPAQSPLTRQPSKHRSNPAELRLFRRRLWGSQQVQRRTRLRRRPRRDAVVVAPGVAAACTPLGDVQDDRVCGTSQLIP